MIGGTAGGMDSRGLWEETRWPAAEKKGEFVIIRLDKRREPRDGGQRWCQRGARGLLQGWAVKRGSCCGACTALVRVLTWDNVLSAPALEEGEGPLAVVSKSLSSRRPVATSS